MKDRIQSAREVFDIISYELYATSKDAKPQLPLTNNELVAKVAAK